MTSGKILNSKIFNIFFICAFFLLAGTFSKSASAQEKASEGAEKKFEPKEQEFTKRQNDLQSKQQAYQKNSATMSDAAKASAEREIDGLQKALQRDNEDAQQDFQAEESRLLTPLLQKMQNIVNKYAADNPLGLVVDASRQGNNLLYADPSSDITKAIVTLYDAAPAAGAAAPAAAPGSCL